MKYKWVISIPFAIFLYLIYVNVLPFGGIAVYGIVVGADDLQGTARLTGPLERVSDPEEADGITFRNLKQELVYFDLKSPVLNNEGEITVKVLFRDNFPEDQKFIAGAKNNESWSYAWKDLYVPFYETLKGYPSVKVGDKQLIMINGREISGIEEIPEDSVIAGNTNIDRNPYVEIGEYTNSENLTIYAALRGGHTFYTYVGDGALNLNISKQDLNWYNDADELKIEIYSFKDEIIGNGTIPDDGDQYNSSILGPVQKGSFSFYNLEKGVYRINLVSVEDLLVKKIEINNGKLVSEGRLFLAGDNPAYYKDKNATQVEVYFKNPRQSTFEFQTYHSQGLQNMTVLDGISHIVEINETKNKFNLSLGPSGELSSLISEKGDVIIDSINYFSFTRDSYFTPKTFRIIEIRPDLAWLKDNVDYVILDYNFSEGGDWKSGIASWDLEDLYIKDSTLSFCLNVPHLGKEEFRNYTIPVDRIEIEVRTPPLWERI